MVMLLLGVVKWLFLCSRLNWVWRLGSRFWFSWVLSVVSGVLGGVRLLRLVFVLFLWWVCRCMVLVNRLLLFYFRLVLVLMLWWWVILLVWCL